jgi:quinol monooxygenase YgiN
MEKYKSRSAMHFSREKSKYQNFSEHIPPKSGGLS